MNIGARTHSSRFALASFWFALIALFPARTYAQTSPTLHWDETQTVSGFAVTVDGVRTDYGLTPLAPDGTCNCAVAAAFLGARHTVIVSAYNASGETKSLSLIVGPTANAGGPYQAVAGVALSVSAAASTDQTSTISSYRWSWGDGTPDTSLAVATASHVYASAGTYNVTVTVADGDGATHRAATTATVAVPAPSVPGAPSPTSGATSVATNVALAWTASGATSYDLYLGTSTSPSLAAANLVSASYAPASLASGTTYFWKVVAKNAQGTTTGPVWSFTTAAAQPLPPAAPTAPNPATSATGVALNTTLSWSASAGATAYDVYFGPANPPALVVSNTPATSYTPAGMSSGTCYYWQVVARNAQGSTPGAVWNFTTITAAPSPLPAGWTTSDVGSVGVTGTASAVNGTFSIAGAGADIWGTADAFRYVYRQLTGDSTVVARVATIQNVQAWSKAGVMIRQSLSAGSAHASMFVTPGKGLAYQRRLASGGSSLNTSVTGMAPEWVRVSLTGQTVVASVSSDGTTWTQVGRDTLPFAGPIYVGLAVTSHDATRLATATFDGVAVTNTPPPALPSGWSTADLGSVGRAGTATAANGTFTVQGSGADIWGTVDAFRFVYQPTSGDTTMVARVATEQAVNAWTKAGVMIRQSLTGGSPHGSTFVTPGNGVVYQRRLAAGAASYTTGVSGAAPRWVKVSVAGQIVRSFVSADGVTWTQIGQDTIPFAGTIYVGLAVTSHDNTQLATATFDNVSITHP